MANGLVERFNGTLQAGLRTLVSDHQKDWDDHLEWFLFAYRTSVHASTKCTPFELVFGQPARVPYDGRLRQFDEPKLKLEPRLYLRHTLQTIGEHRARARWLSEQERDRYKRVYDRKKKTHRYSVGDRVWLYHPVVPRGLKPKLYNLWRGPFVIAEVLSDVNYRLELPTGRRLFGMVHANRLRQFIDRANWPEKPRNDHQMGPAPRLPSGYEELDLDNDLPPSKIIRIHGERTRVTANGSQHREYLVTLKDAKGKRQQWLDEHVIVAGDLIHDFRMRQRDHHLSDLIDETQGVHTFLTGMCGETSTFPSGGMSQSGPLRSDNTNDVPWRPDEWKLHSSLQNPEPNIELQLPSSVTQLDVCLDNLS